MHVLTAFRDCQGARKVAAAGALALSETLGVPVSALGFKQAKKKVETNRALPQEPGKGEAEERAKDVVVC